MTDRETLSQQAYKTIRQHILDGTFSAGDLLSERVLAEESGISRTPLRSAISRLENEGMLARLANGTLMVHRITVEQLLEIVQIRRLLEAAAAGKAAAFPLTPALRRSRDVMRAYAGGRHAVFDQFWLDDEDFHLAVAEASGLHLLPSLLKDMRSMARLCTITRTHDRFEEQALEHLAVIDAIEAGDVAGAAAAMERHFDSARTRFLAWLAHP
ncbi:GntR family transcriptional regulator [Rhizobiaceae bacterium BDR2-2]|uniref:GntR family transcriptional regulator n=1 Tax=Ectorhizobium quercum TaxID=2965071 RepID=A0AAE3SW48_9HYPH|nr:GntR family transcriptional regulator [Ectorhizobium quercum]MCX8998378.1 GntR family transcriptional regulator [Ectorhizobium quercum]